VKGLGTRVWVLGSVPYWRKWALVWRLGLGPQWALGLGLALVLKWVQRLGLGKDQVWGLALVQE